MTHAPRTTRKQLLESPADLKVSSMTVPRRSRPGSRVRSKAPSTRTAIVTLSDITCGDTGLSIKVTVKTQALIISGTARGVETRDPTARNASFEERERTPEYYKTEQFGGGLSLSFDRNKMPDFESSRSYVERNRWIVAHRASINTRRGQTPKQVAEALASKVNENPEYRATVNANPNGTASLTIGRTRVAAT
jgi:hypothetical protein